MKDENDRFGKGTYLHPSLPKQGVPLHGNLLFSKYFVMARYDILSH
jgi:hypothetical protein